VIGCRDLPDPDEFAKDILHHHPRHLRWCRGSLLAVNLRRLLPPVALALSLTVAGHAAERSLKVDFARSRIEFDVKATMDSFTGRLDAYAATVVVVPEARKISQAVLRFRCADLKTGKTGRDKEMLSWLNAGQYPDGAFELASLDPTANGQYKARGNLTFHGVTKPLEFPITVSIDQEVYAVEGVAVVDHREFGLPVFRKFGLLRVDPLVKVRFHVQGTWVEN